MQAFLRRLASCTLAQRESVLTATLEEWRTSPEAGGWREGIPVEVGDSYLEKTTL